MSDDVAITIELDTQTLITNLTRTELTLHLRTCSICDHYYRRRGTVLLLGVAIEATRHDVNPAYLLTRYMRAVHKRHLTGVTLSTRKATPDRVIDRSTRITVQRSCNGCHTSLGDANPVELGAAVEGRPLPDTRMECGCGEQAAA